MPNIKMFNQVINNTCLKEIEIQGNPITWTNKRIGEHRISSKIDKGFGNIDLFNLWLDIKLDRHSGGTSNHRSLTLDLKTVQEKKRSFKFTNSWLRKEEIHE